MQTTIDQVEPTASSNEKSEIAADNEEIYKTQTTPLSSDLERPDISRIVPTVTFPDGGVLAWLQVCMGFLVMFSTWFVSPQEASITRC